MLCNFVLVELLEVESRLLDGEVIKISCEFFHFAVYIEHVLAVEEVEVMLRLLLLLQLQVYWVFLDLSDHVQLCRIGLEELLLVARYSIDYLLDVESGEGLSLVFPSEVNQFQQVPVHLL